MGQGARPPVTRKLPYIKSYRDRHGKVRHYFRKPGAVAVALAGPYGSKAFMEAYWAACENAPKREIGAPKVKAGSFSALIASYYKSKDYRDLKDITKATYRNVLERFRKAHGDLLVRGVRERHIVAILDGLPANALTWRKCIRLILNHAKERGWIDVHPMAGMRRPKRAKTGYRAWLEEDIQKFEAHWPSGSRERLALALLLYTGQRRSDVRVMGRQHVEEGRIKVKQQKGGAELWIPLHSQLKAEIAAAPKTNMTFIVTQYGVPFSAAGFGNWFSEKAQEAGVPPGCTAHGLRKAAARRLAEAGCSGKEIMAVTGHKNLSEVTLYTDAADQERLARQAMSKVETGTDGSNPETPVRQSRP